MNVTYRSTDESMPTASLRRSTTMVWSPAGEIASPECFLPSGFRLLYILTDSTQSQTELGGGVAGEHEEQCLSHNESLPSGSINSTWSSLASMWFLLFCHAISRVQVILQIVLCSIMTHGHFCQE